MSLVMPRRRSRCDRAHRRPRAARRRRGEVPAASVELSARARTIVDVSRPAPLADATSPFPSGWTVVTCSRPRQRLGRRAVVPWPPGLEARARGVPLGSRRRQNGAPRSRIISSSTASSTRRSVEAQAARRRFARRGRPPTPSSVGSRKALSGIAADERSHSFSCRLRRPHARLTDTAIRARVEPLPPGIACRSRRTTSRSSDGRATCLTDYVDARLGRLRSGSDRAARRTTSPSIR